MPLTVLVVEKTSFGDDPVVSAKIIICTAWNVTRKIPIYIRGFACTFEIYG